MKKFVFIISMFILCSTCYAKPLVNSLSTDINILESGEAEIKQTYAITAKDESLILPLNEDEIDDLEIKSGEDEIPYDIKNGKVYIKMSKENFIISYKIKQFVYQFKDEIGIKYDLVTSDKNFTVKVADFYIKSYKPITNLNFDIKVIGKDISVDYNKDLVKVTAVNILPKSSIKVLAKIKELEFKNKININKTFEKVLKEANKKPKFYEKYQNYIIYFILGFLLIIILLIIVIKKILGPKKVDVYDGIIFKKYKKIKSSQDVSYYDTVPCNGDLYVLSFLTNYFKISKNRSNIIGAFILKWCFEQKISLIEDEALKIKLLDDVGFPNKLEAELYNILRSSSNKNIVSDKLLKQYVEENYERMMNWFNSTYKEAINTEVENGKIKIHKSKKSTKIILNNSYVDLINNIKGLKKYILNFNQVPRTTELNEEGYKYLLIVAELLGIGETFATEVLRKNPENNMAKNLLEIEKNKYIFKDIYEIVLDLFEKNTKKKKRKISYVD